jgi:hypothetical protein
MTAMKESLDIEQLLEWAYRTQCVDRSMAMMTPRGPAVSPAGGLGQYASLGTKIDNSSFAARPAGIRVPDDAAIIHDAVLSLPEIWFEWRRGGEVTLWDRAAADGAGRIIEKVAGDWLLRPVCPNGRVAAFGVRLEQVGAVALLIIHAKAGSRPDWCEGWATKAGRMALDHLPMDRRGRARKRKDDDALEEVIHARAVYAAWRLCLARLAGDLAGALAKHEATGPLAPESPWEKPARIVLPGLGRQNSGNANPLI